MRFSERNRRRPRRQEEYDDYVERDVDEGWPYGDEPAAFEPRIGNEPYGEPDANFDRDRNPGMHDADEPIAGSSRRFDERSGLRRRRNFASRISGPSDRFRETAIHRGKGPKGYQRSDERIREDVSDLLTEEAQLDPSDVEITVSGGEVTLEGYVSRRFEKRLAEDWAEEVLGVVHVQNNIRVGHRAT